MRFIVALLLCAQAAFAAPAQVVIIRHGEKPTEGNELSERGRQRADALVRYFTTGPEAARFRPIYPVVYAMAPKGPEGTLRPIQTVTPLANDLKLQINSDYKRKDFQALVDAVMRDTKNDGKMVLICWEHKAIPGLAQAFGATTAPSKWPGGDVYDRAWLLDFVGATVKFTDLPEHLLPGDSDAR